MSASGWGADYNDPSTFLDLFVSDGAFNDPAFSNDQYDKLMGDAKTEADPKKRMEFMKEAEKILLQDEVVLSPNYHRKKSVLIKPFVKKTVIHPFGAEFDYKYWKADAKS
jgi:oligopeptide transport system substrate-binding protein